MTGDLETRVAALEFIVARQGAQLTDLRRVARLAVVGIVCGLIGRDERAEWMPDDWLEWITADLRTRALLDANPDDHQAQRSIDRVLREIDAIVNEVAGFVGKPRIPPLPPPSPPPGG